MDELNCHFVSRFLTKPWEFGQRQLWFYDFDRKQIKKKSSKTLFAQVGKNNAETEKRLNILIETPISNAIKTLLPCEAVDNNIEIHEWSLLRALYLLLLLQCSRASEKESHQSALEVLSWDETKLDQLVIAYQHTHVIIGLCGHPRAPFFYPSHGLFPIPIRKEAGGLFSIYAIPLTQDFAIVAVPHNTNVDDTLQQITSGYISSCSVGATPSKVIVHPLVLESHGISSTAQMIEDARKRVLEMHSLCGEINELEREMVEIVFGNPE